MAEIQEGALGATEKGLKTGGERAVGKMVRRRGLEPRTSVSQQWLLPDELSAEEILHS